MEVLPATIFLAVLAVVMTDCNAVSIYVFFSKYVPHYLYKQVHRNFMLLYKTDFFGVQYFEITKNKSRVLLLFRQKYILTLSTLCNTSSQSVTRVGNITNVRINKFKLTHSTTIAIPRKKNEHITLINIIFNHYSFLELYRNYTRNWYWYSEFNSCDHLNQPLSFAMSFRTIMVTTNYIIYHSTFTVRTNLYTGNINMAIKTPIPRVIEFY